MTQFFNMKKEYWRQNFSSRLPAGYREVEYLESTGEQWIDTGVYASGDTYAMLDAQFTTNANGFLFGARKNTIFSPWYTFGIGTSATVFQCGIGIYGTHPITSSDANRHLFRLDKGSASVDDMAWGFTPQTFQSDYKIYLFACNQNNSAYIPAYLRAWDVVLTRNDAQIRSFVPCVRISDNKPGMYDLCGSICSLTGTPFYINSGTGADFLWGELPENLVIPRSLGYVTDGLIAMWDGEYNAGTYHSPNATAWKDCVGGMALNWIGDETYEWLDKCCHFKGTSGYGCFCRDTGVTESSQKVGTLEVSRSWETVTSSGTYASPNANVNIGAFRVRLPKDPTYPTFPAIYSPNYQRNWGAGAYAARTVHTDVMHSTSTSSPDTTLTAWKDGVKAASYSHSGTVTIPMSANFIGGMFEESAAETQGGAARIYCVRYYSRALTQAELQQNYNVDVTRFGTTYNPQV